MEAANGIWWWKYNIPSGVMGTTRPFFNRRKLVESLNDRGFLIILREPVNRDRPLSMDARYDESFIWKVRALNSTRSWDVFNYNEYVDAWTEVLQAQAEYTSSIETAGLSNLGSLEEEYFKELKTKCYEIKLGNRQEGEGAFKLLTYLRSHLRIPA